MKAPRRKWTPAEDRTLRELAGTVSAERISTITGRTKSAVHGRIKSLGLNGRLHGEHHWNAKVGKLRAAMIGALSDAGFTPLEIKNAFGLDLGKTTIDDIAAGRSWRN